MAEMGFVNSDFDEFRYICLKKDCGRTIIVAYVDYILFAVRNDSELHNVVAYIWKHMWLRVDISVTTLLGMCVE